MRTIGHPSTGTAIQRVSFGVAIPLLLLGIAMLVFAYTAGTPRTSVPRVVGKTKSAALERLAQRHLSGKVIKSTWAAHRLPSRFAGQIVHQTWKQGVRLPEGGVVTLTLYPRAARHQHGN
jgi:hypothetical protein